MSSYNITTKHQSNLTFKAVIDGHEILTDTLVEHGGSDKGASPKKIFLSMLSSCTGMDVVSILHKMKVVFEDFEINTQAELSEEMPKVFTLIHVTYRIKVKAEDRVKVEKAIALSEEKYCGISAMLKKNCPINFEIDFL